MLRIIFSLALILFFRISYGQVFYETSWQSDGTTYTGLLIYYDDNDALMRVKYKLNDKLKVAEYQCTGEFFESDGFDGYLLDGQNAKIVYGNPETGYSADNFVFLNLEEGAAPFTIDDNGLEKEDSYNYFNEVDYWEEISVDKFTESYVYSFFERDEPLYNTLLSFNIQNNAGNANENYRISSMAFGQGEWAITMSKGTELTTQSWNRKSDFPKEWIREKWDEDFYITALIYGDGEWAVTMSQSTGYTRQAWKKDSDYPVDWIQEKWTEDFDITSIAYGGGVWIVVMSKGPDFANQWLNTKQELPTDWIIEAWDEGYDVTALSYGNEGWSLVMSKGSGYTTQSLNTTADYPKSWIREKWDEGYDITAMAYGNGEWVTVMSKGTGYTTQTWKTNATYPRDWIREKWNGSPASNQNVDQPELVNQNSELHLILVTNTIIPDIGGSCEVDKNRTVNEFNIIAEELEIPITKSVIDGRNFTRQSVNQSLNNLDPGSNDVVVFIYSGHGYRWSNQTQNYPTLDLRYSEFDRISENNAINLETVFNTIKSKGARLNIVIGDCCNSDVGVTNRGGDFSLASRRQTQGQVAKLRKLFLESKGNLITAAAKPYETSCGNSRDGGYFISSFFAALSKETSYLNDDDPEWENIISRTIKTANYKTQNLRGCDPQNGIYHTTIN